LFILREDHSKDTITAKEKEKLERTEPREEGKGFKNGSPREFLIDWVSLRYSTLTEGEVFLSKPFREEKALRPFGKHLQGKRRNLKHLTRENRDGGGLLGRGGVSWGGELLL